MTLGRLWGFEPTAMDLANGKNWLNIGCGSHTFPGFLNTDMYPGDDIDQEVNLNDHPLPFDDDTFDFIYASHVLEHVLNLEDLITELIRISRSGTIWEIHSPIGRDALEVIDHVRLVTEITFRNWTEEWGTKSAHVLKLRENIGRLILIKKYYTRDIRIGPISAYHFRKYLKIEPPWKRNQMVLVFGVRK